MKIAKQGYELELNDSGRITMTCYDLMSGRADGFISMDLSTEELIQLDTALADLIEAKVRE